MTLLTRDWVIQYPGISPTLQLTLQSRSQCPFSTSRKYRKDPRNEVAYVFSVCPKKTRDSLEITTVNSLGSDVPCGITKWSLTIKMDKISLNFTDQRINMG